MTDHYLHNMLSPNSITVVGASTRKDSPGYLLVRNIIDGEYKGKLWLVNARHSRMFGLKGYRSVRVLPETPDLAIILTPEATLLQMISNCAERGVRVAIIMTVTDSLPDLARHARKMGVRILGSGSAGIVLPALSLNATFTQNRITEGHIAVVSQSAALVSAVVDWAESNDIGFSSLISTGQESDIAVADLVDYLAHDYSTRAIILYIDKIRRSREFLSAVSAAARNKPVLILKSTQNAARFCDAVTRTGEVYSSDRVYQAALERAGVVRIRTFSNLFTAARTLSSGALTRGKRLALVSNGAALSMLACDRIQAKGFELPALNSDLVTQISGYAGTQWSAVNPVVLRHNRSLHESIGDIIRVLLDSPLFDAILVLYAPDPRCDTLGIANGVADSAANTSKPVMACWMGESLVTGSRQLFQERGILSFRTPEAAIDAVDFMYRYQRSQQLLLQLPDPVFGNRSTDFSAGRKIVLDALTAKQRVLEPATARTLLNVLEIPVIESAQAATPSMAAEAARSMGFPVAIKLVSPSVQYRSDVGGVRLNIQSEAELINAFASIHTDLEQQRPGASFNGVLVEPMRDNGNSRMLALRVFRDPTFGPVISVGLGGDLLSLVYQRPVQLPPLNQFLIDDMLKDTHLVKYLGAFRNKLPVNLDALSAILRQVSGMICEIPEIYEIDINPLSLNQNEAIALDVQVVVQKTGGRRRGYPHLAIHPYPRHWIRSGRFSTGVSTGKRLTIRPIRPEDGEGIAQLVHNMSPESRYMRFMHAIDTLPPRMVAQFTKIDYDRQMAFCAIPESAPHTIIGVSRYAINPGGKSTEFAIAIADEWQGMGLSKQLMSVLIEHARAHDITSISGDVLRQNQSMRGLMESMGFTCTAKPAEPEQLMCTLELG